MSDKKIIIVTISNEMNNFFDKLDELNPVKVHLLDKAQDKELNKKLEKKLDEAGCEVSFHKIGHVWEDTFKYVKGIVGSNKEFEVITCVASGTFNQRSSLLNASFVNGIKAYDVNEEGRLYMMPMFKFSYYTILTVKKLQILKFISDGEEVSFEGISKGIKMSLPLVSYHINGNLKSEGLKGLQLIKTSEKGGKTYIRLSILGRMLLNGYIDQNIN